MRSFAGGTAEANAVFRFTPCGKYGAIECDMFWIQCHRIKHVGVETLKFHGV